MPIDRNPQRWADWVVELCLLHGTSMGTAYQVAGLFVGGLQDVGAPWRSIGWTPPNTGLTTSDLQPLRACLRAVQNARIRVC